MTPSLVKDQKITWNTATMLWFSGLRGAVAYACAKTFPDDYGNRTAFVITTMVIVLVTVFILGGTTEVVLGALEIEMNVDEDKYMQEQSRFIANMMAGKNAKQMADFEEKTLIPCVVRVDTEDCQLQQSALSTPSACMNPLSPTTIGADSSRSFTYSMQSQRAMQQQSVEMTDMSHQTICNQMGYALESAAGRSGTRRRIASIYDYGTSV